MRNQPKYHFFKNSSYAMQGLREVFANETSFKIEVVIALILLPWIFILGSDYVMKVLMFVSLFGMLVAEVINSAIERVVDLVTLEHHEMAKKAKDAGSAIVFLSIVIFIVTWGVCLYEIFI